MTTSNLLNQMPAHYRHPDVQRWQQGFVALNEYSISDVATHAHLYGFTRWAHAVNNWMGQKHLSPSERAGVWASVTYPSLPQTGVNGDAR